MDLRLKGNIPDLSGQAASVEGRSPRHQLSYFNSVDLPGNMTFDAWLRYMDALPSIAVESYVTLDARLAWRPRSNLEISLVGQNLIERSHREFVSADGLSTKIQRGLYGKIVFEF
jgi:iron complex outermembrane receptor protein